MITSRITEGTRNTRINGGLDVEVDFIENVSSPLW